MLMFPALMIAASVVVPTGSAHAAAATVYVSSGGSDSASGDSAHPFLTLTKARDYVRTINGNMTGDIDVILKAGRFPLTSPLSLGAGDSGTNGYKVNWKAESGASPVISGGSIVTGWASLGGSPTVYKAHVGAVDTRQLYVNGERETRARGVDNPSGFTKTATGFTAPSTTMASYTNVADMEVTSRWGWKLYRCPVQSISGTTITMQQPCWNNANLQEGQEFQNPSWFENAFQLLDAPGEWYLDKAAGDIFYIPKSGQNMSTAQVVIPTSEGLINASGTLSAPISNISFSGITFADSSWLAPNSDDGMAEGQANFRMVGTNSTFDSTRLNWQKTPGAVNVGFSRNISFSANTFTRLGAVGLNFNTGSQGSSVVGNVFSDISATGIQIGGTDVVDHHPTDGGQITKNTTVANNVVHTVGVEYTGSVGILATYTEATTITHNKLYDLPYSGISVGWGWGLTDQGGDTNQAPGNAGVPIYSSPTPSKNNVVSYNDVGDIMKLQADGGAIYTLSSNPGSSVANNFLHGVPAPAYGAIYQDEGSRYFRTTGNALCDVAYQWLIMNHGLNITADNNFTTQPAYTTQGNTLDTIVANNTTVSGCAQLPASTVNNAGLEAAYKYLSPNPSPTDTVAPTVPASVSAAASFPTTADVSWTASTDGVGVTGYSVYRNGVVVGASSGTTVTIGGLTPGSTGTYTVTARDAAGNESSAGTAAVLVQPSGSDLAAGKTATASSSFSGYGPALAVDADAATRWAQGAGLPDPSWLKVDLGARFDISGVVTTFEKPSGYKYKVETSLDNSTWTVLEDHTASFTSSATNYSASARPSGARYVRLTITGSSGNGGSVYSLQVYGRTDLSLATSATASSSSSGFGPGLATDGNLSTRWAQALMAPDPSWLQNDLGSVKSVSSVVATFEMTAGYRYRIEYSTDGTSWSVFDDRTANPTAQARNVSNRATPVMARYLKVTVTNSSSNGGSLYELQSYSTL